MVIMLLILRKNNMQQGVEQSNGREQETEFPEWLELVRRQVKSLKFGHVQIIVHDSRVTQVERVEKMRLDRPKPGPTR
jgi:hypothetical protein